MLPLLHMSMWKCFCWPKRWLLGAIASCACFRRTRALGPVAPAVQRGALVPVGSGGPGAGLLQGMLPPSAGLNLLAERQVLCR